MPTPSKTNPAGRIPGSNKPRYGTPARAPRVDPPVAPIPSPSDPNARQPRVDPPVGPRKPNTPPTDRTPRVDPPIKPGVPPKKIVDKKNSGQGTFPRTPTPGSPPRTAPRSPRIAPRKVFTKPVEPKSPLAGAARKRLEQMRKV